MLDLKNLKPNVISRDLKGYTVAIYGAPKSFGHLNKNI